MAHPMDTREHEPYPRMPEFPAFALGIVTAIVYVAGFAMVAAWFALLLIEQPRPATAPRADAACGACGVVEAVRELEPAPELQLRGTREEGAVLLLAALGGVPGPRARQAKIYETTVRHDDGSLRVLREASAPHWQRGDRVRVIKGRVAPAAISAAAVPGALPAERTPTPAPPAAPAW